MLMAGVLAGTVIGILPGLGGIACVAILLPFIYTMDVHSAMVALIGSLAVVHTSDTITSVLIDTPGWGGGRRTVLDGHPLAKQGEAGRALSAAFLSSMIGGLIGTLFLTLSLSHRAASGSAIRLSELLMLCVLGLSFAGFLTGGRAPQRRSLGMPGTLAGKRRLRSCRRGRSLHLRPALPVGRESPGWSRTGNLWHRGDYRSVGQRRPDRRAGRFARWLAQGAKDVAQHWGIVLRGSLIGVWAGILPGIGATAGSWMAYGHVVAMARDRERFGKGDIRGVIGPESANNSVEAGDLIPTLLFSVPGGAPSAILLGALFFYGIQPGPRMVQENLDLIFTIIWSFAIANAIGAALSC